MRQTDITSIDFKNLNISVRSNYITSDYVDPIINAAVIGIGGALIASTLAPMLGGASLDASAIKTSLSGFFLGTQAERFSAAQFRWWPSTGRLRILAQQISI